MCCALSPAPHRAGTRFHRTLSGFAAALAATILPATPSAAAVTCRIQAEPVAGYLRLQALARSDEDLQGRYLFSLNKHSATGTSRNVQSGSFALRPGQDEVLSTVTLDGSAEGHYAANLALEWDQGSTSCHSP
jgi:hypothetical protein